LNFILDASINRSKPSYLNNPPDEIKKYDSDVDQDMTLLTVSDKSKNSLRGSVNWFAVHGTSMNNSNHLVSGDNKGFASYMWEMEEFQAGNKAFVGAFAISNAVSYQLYLFTIHNL
jgi:neutral ceramidase